MSLPFADILAVDRLSVAEPLRAHHQHLLPLRFKSKGFASTTYEDMDHDLEPKWLRTATDDDDDDDNDDDGDDYNVCFQV